MTDPRPPKSSLKNHRQWLLLAALLAVTLLTRQFTLKTADLEETAALAHQSPYEAETAILGTYARVKFWAEPERAERACSQVFEQLNSLHRTINIFDPDSELARLNQSAAAAPFTCSDLLWDILMAARQGHGLTRGIFDPSIAPLMAVWGFHRDRDSLPSEQEILEARDLIGLDKVEFNETARTVRFSKPGMRLDLGGIAKGFALDLAMATAKRVGIECGVIDLGGNIYCFSVPPPGKAAYTVGIRNPFDRNRLLSTVTLLDKCIATSGNYENFRQLQGRRVTHIIDPRTGNPVAGVASTTVITPRGVDSDVFSTAVFIGGDQTARQLLDTCKRTAILRVSLDSKGKTQVDKYGWSW